GVSLLADLILNRIKSSFNVVTKPVDPPVTRMLAVGYKDKLDLPRASRKFIRELKEHIDRLP
ncbi:MAG: LysR family transcriptional regulator, partial [Firmicutes bacterium]|nr:LysR family transcriptional regulator [Bacillota bacterium]